MVDGMPDPSTGLWGGRAVLGHGNNSIGRECLGSQGTSVLESFEA